MLTTFYSTVLSAEINVTNCTDLGVPWYLISEMENNGQSRRPAFTMPYCSVQGLIGPSFFVAAHLNGILAVVVVAIVRISPHAETG